MPAPIEAPPRPHREAVRQPRPDLLEVAVSFTQAQADRLPITKERIAIEKILSESDRVVVVGETGSGKTTMLPEFIYDVVSKGNPTARIIITQPRKIAVRKTAETAAGRLGKERIGHRFKGENTVTDKTQITFTVDGSLLNMLKEDPLLLEYDGVMVDEVHERSIDIDIELALLKKAQEQRKTLGKKPLKLIFASATLDKDKLVAYFPDSKYIEVEGRLFDITDHFSDSEIDREDVMKEAAKKAYSIVIDKSKKGDILIFMPGKYEIDKTISELEALIEDKTIELIPLMGGEQDAASQDRIYAKNGRRKIIVSSDVAKTSLTVPNVTHVIVSGLARKSIYDSNTSLNALQTLEETKSDVKQKRGRAGRVKEGDAYYLFTKENYEKRDEFPAPEIQQADLIALVLRMKTIGIPDVHGFNFIDNPGKENIDGAIETLQKLGALDKNGAITPIGEKMGELPVDPHFARMLVEAKQRGCVEAVSILVGFLSNRGSLFRLNRKQEKFEQKYAEFLAEDSDFLTLLNVWNSYVDKNTSKAENKKWTDEKGLSKTVLYETTRTKNDLLGEESLKEEGFSRKNKKIDISNTQLLEEIKKCITAGFMDRLLKKENGAYKLDNGRKSGIIIGNSSVLKGKFPDMFVSGSIRPVNERTFAELNEVVTEGIIKEVAPYYLKEEEQIMEVQKPKNVAVEEKPSRVEPSQTPTILEQRVSAPAPAAAEVKRKWFLTTFGETVKKINAAVEAEAKSFWKTLKNIWNIKETVKKINDTIKVEARSFWHTLKKIWRI